MKDSEAGAALVTPANANAMVKRMRKVRRNKLANDVRQKIRNLEAKTGRRIVVYRLDDTYFFINREPKEDMRCVLIEVAMDYLNHTPQREITSSSGQ